MTQFSLSWVVYVQRHALGIARQDPWWTKNVGREETIPSRRITYRQPRAQIIRAESADRFLVRLVAEGHQHFEYARTGQRTNPSYTQRTSFNRCGAGIA